MTQLLLCSLFVIGWISGPYCRRASRRLCDGGVQASGSNGAGGLQYMQRLGSSSEKNQMMEPKRKLDGVRCAELGFDPY